MVMALWCVGKPEMPRTVLNMKLKKYWAMEPTADLQLNL